MCELHKKHCAVSSCRRGHFPEVFQHVPTVFPVVLQLLSLALRALEMVALHLLANAHTVGYNDTIMTSNTGKFDFSLLQADCYNFLFIGFIFLILSEASLHQRILQSSVQVGTRWH